MISDKTASSRPHTAGGGRTMTSQHFPVSFDGAKYDLQRFLRDHPGGVNTLKHYRGKSIVSAMEKFDHSASAYHMLSDFKVGELGDSNVRGVSENGRIITSEERGRDVLEIAFLEELEGTLDWSKPILGQLHLVAPHYDRWVNSAVYRPCRLFSSPLLESLTYTPWFIVPLVWIPVILYLGCTQFVQHVLCEDPTLRIPPLLYAYHTVFGVVIWSAVEYCLHRWVFHLDPGRSVALIKLHFIIHGLHHKVPFDDYRQVFPPVPAAALAYGFYLIISSIFHYPLIKMTGGLIGYLTYDLIHCYVHRGSPKAGSYLYSMKRYHSNHHFVNHDKAFGISSKVWDLVFRTLVQVRKLNFNLQWCHDMT